MMNIDLLDKKIIFELDLDSRQSSQQLARKVRSSKEVVAYRLKRLEKNSVIFKYLTVLDPAKLGYFLHKVMFKLENVNTKEKEEIIDYLKNHPYSLWTVECDGPFDIGFMVFARNLTELNGVLTEISNKLNKYIHERVVSTNITGEYFTRRYLIQKSKEKKSRYGENTSIQKIDKTDWQILSQLSKNARISITEIAKYVPIKIDAIRERMRKLEKSGIISGYSILINNNVINQLHYKVLIYLKDFSEKKYGAIRQFCVQNENIIYLIKSLGTWDIEIDIEVNSPEKYREITLNLLKQFPDTIRKYDTLQIYRLHEYKYLPHNKVLGEGI